MQNKQISVMRVLGFVGLTMVLIGCQTAPSRLEENFGSSVRHMVAVQTQPAAQAGYGLDGNKAEVLLDRYRKDAAEPEKVESQAIQIKFTP